VEVEDHDRDYDPDLRRLKTAIIPMIDTSRDNRALDDDSEICCPDTREIPDRLCPNMINVMRFSADSIRRRDTRDCRRYRRGCCEAVGAAVLPLSLSLSSNLNIFPGSLKKRRKRGCALSAVQRQTFPGYNFLFPLLLVFFFFFLLG